MDQLPDDVLLMVMYRLSNADLLACRLVCKRLGGLALHPYVWRRRITIGMPEEYQTRYDARWREHLLVLRLAPCLSRVVVMKRNRLTLFTTRCAIEELDMTLEHDCNPMDFALLIRNQEALGRLKSVVLRCDNSSVTGADALMRTLAASSVLESIFITSLVPTVNCPVPQVLPIRSTLKNFKCELTDNSESFVNAVLAGHAATLEDVDIGEGDEGEGDNVQFVGYWGHTSGNTFRLLAGMPKLRELKSLLLPGLLAVEACEALTVLHLGVNTFKQQAIEEAAELLRRAKHLREVYLDYAFGDDGDGRPAHVGVKLIEALVSSSSRASLEYLSVRAVPLPQALLSALPRLPALQLLSGLFTMGDDEVLLGITPVTAPSLRTLELANSEGDCLHKWLHGDVVKTIYIANPSLHILIEDPLFCNDCEACALKCHQEINRDLDELGLFMHDPDKCPFPEHHSVDRAHFTRLWMKIQ